jgi:NAD(P)H-quinone oxidoreductase subunit 5
LCIITAAIIQSAILFIVGFRYDFTNAGFSIDACRFCKRFWDFIGLILNRLFASNTLIILFIIGGLTAVIAQFTKLLQVNVKQKLACSTIAQMGFMIMQCGFFQCGRRSLTTSWVL